MEPERNQNGYLVAADDAFEFGQDRWEEPVVRAGPRVIRRNNNDFVSGPEALHKGSPTDCLAECSRDSG